VNSDAIVIRRCEGLDELRTCVALQKEVWNFTDAELIPLRMFVVAEKVGGQVMGAFDDEKMVGFALPCRVRARAHISPLAHVGGAQGPSQRRTRRRLKLLRGKTPLTRGIELIRMDIRLPSRLRMPISILKKLGAIARRYNINQYGITSSPLQGGLPSDRLYRRVVAKNRGA